MSDGTPKIDTLIVGGGFAGLAAAAQLARAGRRVTLVEASQTLGGRARTHIIDGRAFNLGPHALYAGGRARALLTELGIDPPGRAPKLGGGFAMFRGHNHTLPTGLASLLTTGLFSLGARFSAARLMSRLSQQRPEDLRETSVQDWLQGLHLDPTTGAYAEAIVRLSTYVNAPEQLSAQVALQQVQLGMSSSVRYLDGGWQPMIDALAGVARQAGATLLTGTKVLELQRQRSHYIAQLGEGEHLTAGTVILATPPKAALRLLGQLGPLPSWHDQLQPVRASCLDVALHRLPRPRATFGLGIDAPTYVSVHSATAQLGPGAVVHVARYLGPNEAPTTRPELEEVLQQLQPGFASELLHAEYHPKMIVSHGLPRPSALDARPGPSNSGQPGIFLAGEWVRSEAWLLDAACASAQAAAQLVLHTQPGVRAA